MDVSRCCIVVVNLQYSNETFQDLLKRIKHEPYPTIITAFNLFTNSTGKELKNMLQEVYTAMKPWDILLPSFFNMENRNNNRSRHTNKSFRTITKMLYLDKSYFYILKTLKTLYKADTIVIIILRKFIILMIMSARNIVSKTLYNSMRCFDVHLSARQSKAMKTLIKGIFVHSSTVLQRLYTKKSRITANKFRESLSYHLERVNLDNILNNKAKKLIKKTMKYNWYNIIAGDASDIFKPHAQAMQWISRVRDGSTGQIGNWYVIYGINVNGITHQVEIKDPQIEYIGSEKRENMLRKTKEIVDAEKSIAIFDRWHDDVGFVDMLQELKYHYIV